VPVSCRPQRSCFGRRGGATGPRRPDRPQRSRSWRRCCRPPPSNSTSTASTASRAGLGRDLRGARRQAAGDVPRLPRRGARADRTGRRRTHPRAARRSTPMETTSSSPSDAAGPLDRPGDRVRALDQTHPQAATATTPSTPIVETQLPTRRCCLRRGSCALLFARERAIVAAVPDRAGDDGDAVLAAGGDSLLGHAAGADGAVQLDAG
jgi:hypothetical protein